MDHYSKSESENHHADPFLLKSAVRWWSKETVGIVTGGNKGIGYAMVKRLAEMGVTVILTARDYNRGFEAFQSIKRQLGNNNNKSIFHLRFFCLDVSDPSSIQSFVSWFSLNFPALDILVNNAAVSFNEIGENSVENAETVMKTNFFGAKLLTQSLLPFFRFSSPFSCRLLNITSRLGSLDKLKNPSMRGILESESVTEEAIERVANRFLEDVKSGQWRSGGWPEQWTDYAVSKMALNSYTRVLARRYSGKGLSANCYCPGFTQTAMTRGRGTHSADAAAEVATAIALLPPLNLPTGKFFAWSNSTKAATPLILHSKL